MKYILGVILLLAASFGPAFGQAAAETKAKKGPSPEIEALKQIERDWSDAQKAGDAEKLSQIIGNDWRGLGYDGNRSTKAETIADLKEGKYKLESFEMGPIDVKILGNVAIVQGSDTEKSTTAGENTSGKWVWTDVFVKRDGKWVAVRSQSAKVK
jgi:uncharacterized protein (TIGR02246 family)